MNVTLERIREAQKFVSKHLPPTPLVASGKLSEQYGCEVYLKLENMQPIGSFKIRGAPFKISQLSKDELKKGVIAASAGNHAQGVAWGSRLVGTKALIVMPESAPLTKIESTRNLGAEIHLEGLNYDDAFAAAQRICKDTGRIFVHAYEDENVICGQGTLGLELLDQLPDLDGILGSIGGGGMMSGVATAVKALQPEVKIIGCQSSGAPSMVESLKKKTAVKLDEVHTFCDGIAVAQASEPMREILQPLLDDAISASDESIAAGVLELMEKAQVLVEGAGAVPAAVLKKVAPKFKGKKLVLIVSGGNIDVNLVGRIIDRGLIKAGRRLRMDVLIPDRPGSLSRLTGCVADEGANILQAIHDRNDLGTAIDQTGVALTIETKGPEHSDRVLEVIEKYVDRLEVSN